MSVFEVIELFTLAESIETTAEETLSKGERLRNRILDGVKDVVVNGDLLGYFKIKY